MQVLIVEPHEGQLDAGELAFLIDPAGRVAVVTGANSGLGYETALNLASEGADVVMACRNREKGERALGEVRGKAPGSSVNLAALDLASLDSIRSFAADFMKENKALDILVVFGLHVSNHFWFTTVFDGASSP